MTPVATLAPALEVPEAQDGTGTARQLPVPKGFKLLINLPKLSEMTDSGNLIIPEGVRNIEEVATVVGFVVAMGPDAYSDEKRFPTGPYCEEGDFVCFRPFTGTRIDIHGTEFRLINDDSVEAVVEDPRGIRRHV
jgi:co-chaperonin GroES (HSP10)|tara:strand:- start:204 stop:608 length:405 start_codon:yes stop_codon:yes gene_type:complete